MTVFELVAKLTLDSTEYENDLKKESQNGSKLAGAWGKVGKAVAVGTAAIGAATVAVGALTKKSVAAYAEYEQLWGGVQKLYGTAGKSLEEYARDVGKSVDEVRGEYGRLEEAQNLMLQQANDAYKTSGMSANKYMEQATSFSAALINSLGGDSIAAAKQTDVAMRAISDNFNTFGGDIQNVQNAFQGFAKQNYTMLDNLKLGYGGTKTEMQRLIADANEYAQTIGMAGDLSIDSFSDIVTAIDLVQQKQGIAGTTAREAATTIEGSLNMTRAAWDNLVAGLANPDADMGKLMDNLIVAIVGDKEGEGLLNNIIPAIQRAVEGIGKFLQAAIPALSQQLPALIQSFLPVIIQSAVTLVTSLIQALPGIVSTLVTMLPQIVEMAVTAIVDALIQATPVIASQAPAMVKAFASALLSSIGTIVNAGVTLISSLANAILGGLKTLAGNVVGYARQIPSKIKSGLGSLASAGRDLIEGLWGGIKSKFDSVIDRVRALASKLPAAVKKVLGISSPSKVFMELGKWIPEGLALGIEKNLGAVYNASNAMADATMFSADGAEIGLDGTTGGFGSIEINVYATPQQSALEIAQIVKRELIKETNQRRLAWA